MSDELESALWRDPPPRPYTWLGRQLLIPRALISVMHDAFSAYAQAHVEACCFLYGTPDGEDCDRVMAAVIPPQRNRRGSFDVDADAIVQMASATRPRGWFNLAQIHTHPGEDAEHSRYDDVHVNSRRALSLVLPRYGRRTDWPAGIGVHEFQSDYWHLLDAAAAALRIRVVEGAGDLLDLR
jgi:proteasome lid subunit RPN8/RPN11